MREFDHRIGFCALLSGYEDQDDADLLRQDRLLQLMADYEHLGDELASQPTLSRIENDVCFSENGALNGLLIESFIDNIEQPPS